MNLDHIAAEFALSEQKRKVEKSLRAARHMLPAQQRRYFERARFDWNNRRIVGDGYALTLIPDTGRIEIQPL